MADPVLFIIKKFYGYEGQRPISNGLRNSARFVVEMLTQLGFEAKLVEAIDGNSVDRLVFENRPDRVVLEALWVSPSKLAELQRLWPRVRWTIRIHSETPFLATEGIAVDWIVEYMKLGAEVSFNSERTVQDFAVLGSTAWLPNYYPAQTVRRRWRPPFGRLEVGCFGAIRPMKNQLIQAGAALRFAQSRGEKLVFHMNGSRVEQFGSSVLKNVEAMLTAGGAVLVLHPWLEHVDFLALVATMEICLQVSLSESFNIVSADAVAQGVPLVGSEAITWLPRVSQAKVDSAESIVDAMQRAGDETADANLRALDGYREAAVAVWKRWIE